MTHWPPSVMERITPETHFDGRSLRCFADRHADLNAMLKAAIARAPEAEAVVSGKTRMTYRALGHQVAALGGGLQSLGVQKGCRVAILLSNRTAFLTTLLACQHAAQRCWFMGRKWLGVCHPACQPLNIRSTQTANSSQTCAHIPPQI